MFYIMLFSFIVSLIITVGSTPSPQKDNFRESNELARHEECSNLARRRFIKNQEDYNKCTNHMINPKFKISESLKMVDSSHASNCRFKVTSLVWAHGRVTNKPYYEGTITCSDKLNRLEVFREDVAKAETELKR